MSDTNDLDDRTTVDDATTVDDYDRYDPNPNERGKWVSAAIAVLGLWMVIEPFLFDLVASQFWNDLIVGVFLLAVGGYNYYRQADEELGSVGAAAVAAVIGLWLLVAPFVFGAGSDVIEASVLGFWNDVVVGLLVFALGAYSAYKIRDWRQSLRGTAT